MLRQVPSESQQHPPEEDSRDSDEAKTDGLAMIFVDEESPAFYGESSNIAFTRYLFQAIWKGSTITLPYKASDSSDCSSMTFSQHQSPSTIQSPRNPQRSASSLPPVEEMDYLVNLYFSGYGSMFPFLHEPTFRLRYDEFKTGGSSKVGDAWLGLLNMIFAMASYADQNGECSAKTRFRKSSAFFVRAESLCSEPAMRSVSLDIVHYLLLAVLYLQGTQRSIQTWSLHGVLVRAAITMGLHSAQSGQRLDPIQQEVRRRTWLTIYCLDKILSVAFGRPPSIPDEYIVVALPSPWASTMATPKRPSDVDINTEFFNASVRLYQIMGRSVATQYRLNLGLTDPDLDESTAVQKASTMRQELRQWASGLPPRLSLCEPGSINSLQGTEYNRLRVILTLRYHYTSILIHRPLLCAMLRYLTMQDKSVGKPLPYRIQLAMAEAQECIRSAESSIDIVHAVLTAQNASSSNLGVWFFTLFYGEQFTVSTDIRLPLIAFHQVFTSSLIILGCTLLTHHGVYDRDDASSASVHRFLAKAAEALDKLDKDNSLVYNCAKFIQNVSEQMMGQGKFTGISVFLFVRKTDTMLMVQSLNKVKLEIIPELKGKARIRLMSTAFLPWNSRPSQVL